MAIILQIFFQIIFLVLTYFIAAIPFGLVLTKVFANKDIREFGSKNIGATNVTRIAGKKLGLATLFFDGFKGALMLTLARYLFSHSSYLHLYLILVGITAVLAHVYPIYLDFKGGKGVATAAAVLFALDPLVGFLTILSWVGVFAFSRLSSLSSLVASFCAIPLSYLLEAPASQIFFCVFLFGLITYRHKENISRLIAGEEKKF
jgi:glycerol-3-phosphate acyltransferase PlsY